jgi:hypothetical protein
VGTIDADALLLGRSAAKVIKMSSSKPAEGAILGTLLGWPLAAVSTRTSEGTLSAPPGGLSLLESAELNAEPAREFNFITLGWALTEGEALGVELGETLGALLGTAVGPVLGAPMGAPDGNILGKALGEVVGT